MLENTSNAIAIFAPQNKHTETIGAQKMRIDNSTKYIYQKTYTSCFPKITAYAFSFLKDNDEAQNIANDTFLSLWENRERINWNENIAPWLFSVAKNKCLNILKKRIHNNNYLQFNVKEKRDYINYLSAQSEAPIKIYEKEVEVLLCKAVEKMTPKVRTTFMLSRMQGMKYSEIAKADNISNRTVEARIKLAMLILRKTFKDYL
ncbi:MAG: RNA polymerase sigma-70 factor [Bacteroidales bacterium]